MFRTYFVMRWRQSNYEGSTFCYLNLLSCRDIYVKVPLYATLHDLKVTELRDHTAKDPQMACMAKVLEAGFNGPLFDHTIVVFLIYIMLEVCVELYKDISHCYYKKKCSKGTFFYVFRYLSYPRALFITYRFMRAQQKTYFAVQPYSKFLLTTNRSIQEVQRST